MNEEGVHRHVVLPNPTQLFLAEGRRLKAMKASLVAMMGVGKLS